MKGIQMETSEGSDDTRFLYSEEHVAMDLECPPPNDIWFHPYLSWSRVQSLFISNIIQIQDNGLSVHR